LALGSIPGTAPDSVTWFQCQGKLCQGTSGFATLRSLKER